MNKKKSSNDEMLALYLLFGFLLCLGLGVGVEASNKKIKTFNIVSIERQNEISGSFFLGCGSVGSETYYYTYTVIGENKYKLLKFRSAQTTIIETNGLPKVKYRLVGKFHCDVILYVPFNTIIKSFKV